ncbi:MAG: hypothetical protein JKX92_08850 [Porticoccaceae bacterium]|nr:hypothetical protein [Porticoccaceae bacterium]
MDSIRFSLIKKQVVIFVILLLCSLALVFGSALYKQKQLDEEKNINSRMRSLQVNIANIALDKILIKDYQSSHKNLTDKGFFDKEKRLAWIEQLQLTADRLGLLDLRYQINSQSEVAQDIFSTPPGVRLFKSRLNFQTRLLHEGDLVSLIADLQSHHSGLLVVEHCKLSRHSGRDNHSIKPGKNRYNFHGLCDIAWYTSDKPAAPGLPTRSRS